MKPTNILAFKKQVVAVPNIKIKIDKDFSELSDSLIEVLEEIQGFSFPKAIVDNYKLCNGGYMVWQFKKLAGFIMFPSFLGMFCNLKDENNHENAFEGILWTQNTYSEKEIAIRKQHKVFEFFEGDSPCTTIKFNKDQTYQLYHVDTEIYPIPLSVSGYVKLVIDLYGFGNFRYYLHQKDFYAQPLNFCPELINLKEVFPTFDIKAIDFNQYLNIP